MNPLDTDAVVAVADLCPRSGATNFELGYLHEPGEPGYDQQGAGWWAAARYRGARLTVEGFARPDDAADALARRILSGGRCTACDQPVVFSHSDRDRGCRWHRDADAWVRGCDSKRRATRRSGQ